MMKSYTAAETIHATPERIWEILTDAGAYSDWDNGINTVEGSITQDAHITVHSLDDPGGHDMTVTDLTPGRSMVWEEGMPLGLFKEVRTFRLLSEVSGTTRFSLSDDVSGPLTMLKRKSLGDVQIRLNQFAAGLKEIAEAA
jgi:hypothetical protein